ncbi:MAG: hypothetical protein AB7M05_10970 [Alphaproteobacteria bacterium]
MARQILNGTGKAHGRREIDGIIASAAMAAEMAVNGIAKTARTEGERAVTYARDTVSAKPLTSVALAFGGGALAAFLIGRFTR